MANPIPLTPAQLDLLRLYARAADAAIERLRSGDDAGARASMVARMGYADRLAAALSEAARRVVTGQTDASGTTSSARQ